MSTPTLTMALPAILQLEKSFPSITRANVSNADAAFITGIPFIPSFADIVHKCR